MQEPVSANLPDPSNPREYMSRDHVQLQQKRSVSRDHVPLQQTRSMSCDLASTNHRGSLSRDLVPTYLKDSMSRDLVPNSWSRDLVNPHHAQLLKVAQSINTNKSL